MTTTLAAPGRRHAVAHRLRVARVDRVTAGAVTITFDVPAHLADDYSWQPGQHVSITGADGTRRSFSICAVPGNPLRVGVRRIPGGAFSDVGVANLVVGDELEVLTPTGRFTADPDPTLTRHHVAVSVGSGITPVLPIVHALLAGEPGSRVTWLLGNRTAAEVMLLDEVAALKDRWPDRLHLVHVLSGEDLGTPLLHGRLDVDRIGALLDGTGAPAVDDWWVCGPQQLVTALAQWVDSRGGRFHSELFHADDGPVRPRRVAPVEAGATVRVRCDGRTSTAPLGTGQSILDAASVVRPDLPFACRGGVCGTCRARLVTGEVDRGATWALEADELDAGYLLTCQAVPTSPDVLVDYDG